MPSELVLSRPEIPSPKLSRPDSSWPALPAPDTPSDPKLCQPELPAPMFPKPDSVPVPRLKKPDDGVAVELPRPGAGWMLRSVMSMGPRVPWMPISVVVEPIWYPIAGVFIVIDGTVTGPYFRMLPSGKVSSFA